MNDAEALPTVEPNRDALYSLCLADPVWADRYEGWIELGRGGSATVVRTHSRAAGEDVALKIFTRVEAEDWQRVQHEVRNAQRLASPFIVRTYSPFLRGSLAWIELEFVNGPNLRQELERRAREGQRFSREQVLAIGSALAQALVTAHEAGVIHRDVKPANVLLPLVGPAAKLGDFGTSRLAGAVRLTRTGLLAGTPQFVAPEVVSGQPAAGPSDVYSLTMCLFLLFSDNRFPFEIADDSPLQWLRAHAERTPLPVSRFDRTSPAELDDLIGRGLAKVPDERPTPAELLAALRDMGAGRRHAIPASTIRAPRLIGVGLAIVAIGAAASIVGPRLFSPTPLPLTRDATSQPRSGEAPTPESAKMTVRAETQTVPSPNLPPPPATTRQTRSPVPAREVSALRAALGADHVTVTYAGRERVLDLEITLVDRSGFRYSARDADGLAAGETLHFAFDAFSPPFPTESQVLRLELAASSLNGAKITRTLLQQR